MSEDWADEIARRLGGSIGPVPLRTAAELRRAKADGMRQAADFIWCYGDGSPTPLKAEILKAADKIEKGEP